MAGEIAARLAVIEETVGRIDKALNGNGRPGLIEDHRCLQNLVSDHLKRDQEDTYARALLAKETKEAKDLLAKESEEAKDMLAAEVKAQRDKISGRTWAIVLAVIGAFFTQAIGLIVLFIRTGGIR